MEKRLLAISDLLASYSMGDFDYEVELSPQLDEIDTIISSINMLGEELRDTTISRDFFSSIYNAVTDMLFVLNPNGTIRDINETVKSKLANEITLGQSFNASCMSLDTKNVFASLKRKLKSKKGGVSFEVEFHTQQDKTIYAFCIASNIYNRSGEHQGYLIIAEDITERKETEKLVLRTILETQDKERKRFADDLHDSLGPELSMTKLMLSNLTKHSKENPKMDELVQKCVKMLDDSITNLREICFDIMPGALDKGGLIDALKQLVTRVPIKTTLKTELSAVPLEKWQEVALYRVFQEFINNSLKHSQATRINIQIQFRGNRLEMSINDNGIGFDQAKAYKQNGRGLNTMITRVETFGGIPIFTSKIGEGTKLQIYFKC